jgi:hypothetical protein
MQQLFDDLRHTGLQGERHGSIVARAQGTVCIGAPSLDR